ncbi:GOLPH3/VPS74 family protein [Parvularcula sp. LCG005]|uniref:GOLPH3/VPS74 family protein n=1 Tax=Parvularcula sp. LCG005 TaxID=3078805 RepID=UPI002943EAA9|nr:GPP34 family phosphoprotein [Parvularcula sp. LCG005]WOI53158.1 GPP34 family phosphoprotein [Parvularcula sp. LCG005]
MASSDLTLPEELMLLALSDRKGVKRGQFVDMALAGAGLSELLLRGIVYELPGEKNKLAVKPEGRTGDVFLDRCLEIIRAKGLEGQAKTWVQRIGSRSGISKPVSEALVQKHVLTRERQKYLWFFERTVYPEMDPSAELRLKERLASAMFSTGMVSPRDAVLIALANQTGLLRLNFDTALLKEHKARIKEISKGDHLAATAAVDAIRAVQTAVMIAAIMPGVVVSAS